MLDHESLRAYFDYEHPTPVQIRERYRQSEDLSGKHGLTVENVLDALMTLRNNQHLVLPGSYSRLLLDTPHPKHRLDDYRKTTKHFHHWRYAPDVKLNTTEMILEDAERQEFSLKSGMRHVSWDFKKPHRGFGIVDVRSGEYTLWPFLYLLEGVKMQDLSPQLIQTESTKGFDVVGYVPSLKSRGSETLTLKNVPYLPSGEPHVLSTQLHPTCQCKWSHYGPRRVDMRRYRPGERMMCRHAVAFYKHLIEESEGLVLDVLPKPTGIMNPWWTLNQRTILANNKLTITRMNALLGMLIGSLGTGMAFDLS